MSVVFGSIQLSYETQADYTAWNGTLLEGQVSIVSDAGSDSVKLKIGDGTTAWNALPFFAPGASANPTSDVIPINSGGAFADSYLSQDASTLRLADGRTFTSLDGRSLIDFGSGTQVNLSSSNAFADVSSINITPTQINFDSDVYNITNIATDSYLYVDASGNIIAGTAPLITAPSLSSVLDAGNLMNGTAKFYSPDGTSAFLQIGDNLLDYECTTVFHLANIEMGASGYDLQWTNAAATLGGQHNITTAQHLLYHTTKLTFTAPIYNFSSLTASTVPILNASKNLISSAITPTELGHLTGATSPLQAQIDALVTGLSWKQSVRVATTIAGTLSSDFFNGQTIDGVVIATGDRILIKDQASATENGIYTVNNFGAPTRSLDMNAGSEFPSATVAVQEGTVNQDTQFVCNNDAPVTIGVTNISFVAVGGTTYVGTTNRITVTGNVIDIAAAYDALWQPIDADLTSIAGLSASNDDFIQRKSGAWANRTIAQVQDDLEIDFLQVNVFKSMYNF
jgi:hypothetical protein